MTVNKTPPLLLLQFPREAICAEIEDPYVLKLSADISDEYL